MVGALEETASGEPMARRTIFASFRRAAVEMWGNEGLASVAAHMTAEARTACIDSIVIEQGFLPERFVLAWYEAAWAGPAQRDKRVYLAFLDRMMDVGFGRVRSVLLGLASPTRVASKAAELWRHDHTHGDLVVMALRKNGCEFELRRHAYLTTPLARTSVTEIIRYAIALSNVRAAQAQHYLLDPDVMQVIIEW